VSTENSKQPNKNAIDSPQGSGSEYHREHAGNVPDYGGNSMEQIAKDEIKNQTDSTK
jgi:hypothetical protein